MKVKTFTSPLAIFQTQNELADLDAEVNRFIESAGIKRIVSVSDTVTSDDSGATIGLIRVVAYE